MAAFDSDVDVTVEMGFRNHAHMAVDGAGWVSAPDSAGLSVTGDLDLRIFVAANRWLTEFVALLAKWNPERSYRFTCNPDGTLRLNLSSDGSATTTVNSDAPIDVVEGEQTGLRVTWRQSDGRVQFFQSTDDGVGWNQVGSDETIAIASIHDGNSEVRVGNVFDGLTLLNGSVYRAEIRDGIDGTVVGNVDFSDGSQGWVVGDDAGDTGSDGSNTWTLVGDAVIEAAAGLFDVDPVWTDVSDQVKLVSFQRGRSSIQDDFPAGVGELFLDNTAGDFYPWNTASPHYPHVTVGIQVRITATHNSVSYPLFRGYVSRWPMVFPTNIEELARVEIIELFARLQDKKVSGSYVTQTTDERVAAVLDDVGWPATLRNLDSGLADVAARVWDKVTALFLMRTATEAEQGQLFQAANGELTFVNRVAATGVASQATFGPDGAELIYADVSVVHDDDFLINEALISGADEIERSAKDDPSAAVHGPVTYSSENLSIVSHIESANVAEWIVGKHKDVEPRISELAIDPAGSPTALWPEVLGRELRDVITVEASYPGSATQFVQAVAVESVSHRFEAGGVWTVIYGCHPLSELEQESFWIVGTSQVGIDTTPA